MVNIGLWLIWKFDVVTQNIVSLHWEQLYLLLYYGVLGFHSQPSLFSDITGIDSTTTKSHTLEQNLAFYI